MQHLCRISVGQGRTEVYGTVYEVGSDLLVVVGGTGLHIGAASLAERSPGGETALGTVTGRGHKEAELTDKVAARILAATGRRTLALSGIHLERITKEEIEEIRTNVEELARSLAARLGGRDDPGRLHHASALSDSSKRRRHSGLKRCRSNPSSS